MKKREMQRLLALVGRLTRGQRQELMDRLKAKSNAEASVEVLESVGSRPGRARTARASGSCVIRRSHFHSDRAVRHASRGPESGPCSRRWPPRADEPRPRPPLRGLVRGCAPTINWFGHSPKDPGRIRAARLQSLGDLNGDGSGPLGPPAEPVLACDHSGASRPDPELNFLIDRDACRLGDRRFLSVSARPTQSHDESRLHTLYVRSRTDSGGRTRRRYGYSHRHSCP